MIEDCANKGYTTPKWSTNAGSTTVVFPGVTVTAKTNDAVSDAVNIDITSNVKSRLIEIVNYIALNQKTKVNDLVSHFNVSERTIKENLKVLIEFNLVVYSGSKKAGFYMLTKDLYDKLHE